MNFFVSSYNKIESFANCVAFSFHHPVRKDRSDRHCSRAYANVTASQESALHKLNR